MNKKSEFKIMQSKTIKSIPWGLIEPHEKQAQLNHYQTLQRLHERGGLSPCEAVAVIKDRKWEKMDMTESERQLNELISQYQLYVDLELDNLNPIKLPEEMDVTKHPTLEPGNHICVKIPTK